MTDCEFRNDAAAYVLGALEDWERFREHLATCDGCRAEVADLQAVVDLLPATVKPAVASSALRVRIMAGVRSEAELLNAAGERADAPPARRRGLFAAPAWLPVGGAALAAGLAAALALLISGGSGTSERVRNAALASSEKGARVQLIERGRHGELVLRGMRQAPAGQIFEVWLKRGPAADPERTDALFGVTNAGDASVTVPDLRGVTQILVTHEPVGGSAHPTSTPLLSVTT
jgi:Anti-sigma-K factor rskA/Putative zinc-finger